MEHISRERLDELTAALRGCGRGQDFCKTRCIYRGDKMCLRRMLNDAAETLEVLYDFRGADRKKGAVQRI
jgi:hypothetical protein